MDAAALDRLAEALDRAAQAARAIPWSGVGDAAPGFGLDQAYAVQRRLTARRAARGDATIGAKVGLTRREKWASCGAADVILGGLSRSMLLEGTLPVQRFIAPGVEPELAFRLARPLQGEIDTGQAAAAIDAVAPALEVADSRLAEPGFVLPRIVADNSNSAGLAIGDWQSWPRDVAVLDGALEIDGVVVAAGNTRSVLGDPLLAVVAAARLAAGAELRLDAGSILLSGSLVPAHPLRDGQRATCRIEGLGAVSLVAIRGTGPG
jgi:2-oxo-3-hexenedioate decarboxylase